jgi:acyl-CoA dehydrogenase
MLGTLASDVFRRECTSEVVARAVDGAWPAELWSVVEETGLTRVGVSERNGGAGGGWLEAMAIVKAAARYAAPIPLAETAVLAAWQLDDVGLEVPPGVLAAASDGLTLAQSAGGDVIRGVAARVPWARHASTLVAIVPRGPDSIVVAIPSDRYRVEHGHNLAGEPRDAVTLDDVPVHALAHAETEGAPPLMMAGALVRSIQIAGGLERVLRTTTEYVGLRRQFGRPLAAFQAVQQQLALLAGEAAATDAAATAAARISDSETSRLKVVGPNVAPIAAAKLRASDAARDGARIAHQLHGAIGVTHEHHLRHFTTRLLSWRQEFGDARYWAIVLGHLLLNAGDAGAWAILTGSDEVAST